MLQDMGPQHADTVLLIATTMDPAKRLGSEAGGKAWLDAAAVSSFLWRRRLFWAQSSSGRAVPLPAQLFARPTPHSPILPPAQLPACPTRRPPTAYLSESAAAAQRKQKISYDQMAPTKARLNFQSKSRCSACVFLEDSPDNSAFYGYMSVIEVLGTRALFTLKGTQHR